VRRINNNLGVALCCAILFHSTTVVCQTTFNKHYHFGLGYIQTGGVLTTDDGYVYVGQCIDTSLFNFHWIFGKMDLNGEPICYRISEPGYSQVFTSSEVIEMDNGNYLTMGNDSLKNILALIMDDQCDIVQTRKYKAESPDEEIISIGITSLKRTADEGYVAIGSAVNGNDRQRGAIFKFDKDLNLIWQKYYGSEYGTLFGQVLPLENNNLLVFGSEDDISFFGHDFIIRIIMLEYDEDGSIIASRHSETQYLRHLYFGAAITPQGDGFITSACHGREDRYASFPDSLSYVVFQNAIQKLDSNLQLIWETQIGHHDWATGVAYPCQVIASDSTGVVAAGQAFINRTDSTPDYQYGVISKVGWDGDSIWSRLLMADTLYRADHYIFNMDVAEDGGYIINGMANWREGWPPIIDQHLWLIKTDEFGCIVPGCHLITALPPELRDTHEMLLYPNPASTEIHIYISSTNIHSGVRIQISDLMGNIMYSVPHLGHDVTYSVNVADWPPGQYYSQVIDGDHVTAIKPFVIAR
jgi:hypothetical protein